MNEIQLFSYGEEKRPVRTVEIDGEIWFVAKDVCDILELSNVSKTVQGLDEDEKDITKSYTLGGEQKMLIISEAGLYKLAFRSNKPEAKKFVRWVTHTVLPTIRQTGRFNVSDFENGQPEQSVESGLQRASLIIRAAEHKAVPQSEQLRLLSIAVKDLTGTDLNVERSAPQKCQVLGLMDLPEVFGTIKKGKSENFGRGIGSVRFYSILEIADTLGVTPSEFNDFADEHNMKVSRNGKWVRVETAQGEAREFLYLRNVFVEYREEVR